MKFTSGLPETACGRGSMLSETVNVREHLPKLLSDLDIKLIIDIPCGDMNWIRHVNLSGINYIGIDHDQDNCHRAMRLPSEPGCAPISKMIVCTDLFEIPSSVMNKRVIETCHNSLAICRDFIQHLPNADIHSLLRKFRVSSYEWLLITSHYNDVNEDISARGGFRQVNLTRAPFNLPAPVRTIKEPANRYLGLWHWTQL